MSDKKIGSSYLTDDSKETSEGGGGRKLRYIYPDKSLVSQYFVVIPDQGDWAPYAPQTVRYHGGAVKIHIKGEESKGPRKVRVVCKGRECPVCRDLDKKYPQIKDQPFAETRRHTKLFLVVPVQFRRGQYSVDKTVQFMQVEYPFRYDSVSKESINVEWKDLSHTLKGVIDRGMNPFDLSKAIVIERNRDTENSPTGKGTRKVWRHSVVTNPQGEAVTIEMPHDLMDQMKNHYTLEGYARDIGIPDLHVLVDVGNQQVEILDAMTGATATERAGLAAALEELNQRLHTEVVHEGLRHWIEGAEKYAASRDQTSGEDEEPAEEVTAEEPRAQMRPTKVAVTTDAEPTRAEVREEISAAKRDLNAALPSAPMKTTGDAIKAEKTMSAADAVRAKYGLRK